MKKVLSIAATAVLVLSFSGCLDDDDVVEAVYGDLGSCVYESESSVTIWNNYPKDVCEQDGSNWTWYNDKYKSCSEFSSSKTCSVYTSDY